MTTLPPRIPPLRHGDRLNADEFMRRYERMPDVKAELIGGVVYIKTFETEGDVYMASPLRAEQHGDPHADMMLWLGTYMLATPGVRPSDGSTVLLADDSVPEPDASMRILRGGGTRIEDGYIVGRPELAVEISASTASIDRTVKFEDYRANGVREYLLWRTEAGAIDWFRLDAGAYVPIVPDGGVLKSVVFPGLWLHATAMVAMDIGRVIGVLQQGLATAEHSAFVAALAGPRLKRAAPARRTGLLAIIPGGAVSRGSTRAVPRGVGRGSIQGLRRSRDPCP